MWLKINGWIYLLASFLFWMAYSVGKFAPADYRYVALFFAIFFFLFSSYRTSFAYPEKKNKLSLVLNLVVLPIAMVIGSIFDHPSGDMAGMYVFFYVVVFVPLVSLVSLGICAFLSRAIFAIDQKRKALRQASILKYPILVSMVYFFLFSIQLMFQNYLHYNKKNIEINIKWIIHNILLDYSLPLVLAFIPICITIIFVYALHRISEKITFRSRLLKNISLALYLCLTIIAVVGYSFSIHATLINYGNATFDMLMVISFASFLLSPFVLLFHLKMRELAPEQSMQSNQSV